MKKFKKITGVLLAGALCIATVGCQKESATDPTGTTTTQASGEITEASSDTEQAESTSEPTEKATEPSTEKVSKRPGSNEEDLVYTDIYFADFENGTTDFGGRSEETIEVVEGEAYEGAYCLRAGNRTKSWNGMKLDVTSKVQVGQRYYVSAYVKYTDGGAATQRIYVKMDYNNGNSYLNIGSVLCTKGEWAFMEGYIEIPAGTTQAAFYFETEYSETNADYLVDIYVDNFYVQEIYANSNASDLPSLYEEHADKFKIGVAVGNLDLQNEEKCEIIKQHFNSMTMGNEMKPENILDFATCSSDPEKYRTEPALDFSIADVGLTFAQENGISMRGHVLVWHSQTPRWFFTEDYSDDPNAPLASKEIMLARMESYIKQVLTYVQTNYPGVVYCWDVVNEAIQTGDGEPGGYRKNDSYWYQIVGPEFIEKAFEYARTYADEDVKLFYNDYNCYDVVKMFAIIGMLEPLVEKGLVDGVGMQSHITQTIPSMVDYEYTIQKFANLGIEVQITELDIDCTDNSLDGQLALAKRYKRLMNSLYKLEDAGTVDITCVTVWGLTDDGSWLNGDKAQYPLLFNAFLQAKEAFWGFFRDPSVADW